MQKRAPWCLGAKAIFRHGNAHTGIWALNYSTIDVQISFTYFVKV
jgi:hypothetical protein